jgi:hypothetical protein
MTGAGGTGGAGGAGVTGSTGSTVGITTGGAGTALTGRCAVPHHGQKSTGCGNARPQPVLMQKSLCAMVPRISLLPYMPKDGLPTAVLIVMEGRMIAPRTATRRAVCPVAPPDP